MYITMMKYYDDYARFLCKIERILIYLYLYSRNGALKMIQSADADKESRRSERDGFYIYFAI